MLSGMIGIIGRGAVAQTVIGTLISFYFFALSYRECPFKKNALNQVKIFSEFQLFCILLVCTTIQANSAEDGFKGEPIDLEGYGDILTVLTIAILPVAIYFLVTQNCCGDDDDDNDNGEVANPLGVEDEPLTMVQVKAMDKRDLTHKCKELGLHHGNEKYMKKTLKHWIQEQKASGAPGYEQEDLPKPTEKLEVEETFDNPMETSEEGSNGAASPDIERD